MAESLAGSRVVQKALMRPVRLVPLAFLAVITVGTLLLLLPWAHAGEGSATLVAAAFTAVSATCVTGLTAVDTATYWTTFGHAVMVLLTQVGGFGIMSAATLLAFIVRGPIDLGFILVAGSMTLALLVLPTVILASREAIRAVPPSIREGSLALGATPWQTIRRQVLPASIPGMATGVILAISRALGETAPLLLVGATTFVTFDPQPFSTDGYSALPVLIFEYAKQPQAEFRELAAAGVIVMLIVLLAMNSFAVWLRNRYEQSW